MCKMVFFARKNEEKPTKTNAEIIDLVGILRAEVVKLQSEVEIWQQKLDSLRGLVNRKLKSSDEDEEVSEEKAYKDWLPTP